MTSLRGDRLPYIVRHLLSQGREKEWIEFKENYFDHEKIGRT